MNKNTELEKFVVTMLAVLAALFVFTVMFHSEDNTSALPVKMAGYVTPQDVRHFRPGGDCFSDYATGDTYNTPDWYCLTGEDKPAVVIEVTKNGEPVNEVITPDVPTTSTPDVPVIDPPIFVDPPVTPDVPTDEDKPVKEDKPKTNNGNHYGNDKPDNNDHDNKNKHDGDDTRADFEQTKNESKSDNKNDHQDNGGGNEKNK